MHGLLAWIEPRTSRFLTNDVTQYATKVAFG